MQLEAVKRDHSSFDGAAMTDQLNRAKDQQLAAERQLAVAKQQVNELEETEKNQKQRIDELTAELALMQTKLKGMKSASGVGGASVTFAPVPTHTCQPQSALLQKRVLSFAGFSTHFAGSSLLMICITGGARTARK